MIEIILREDVGKYETKPFFGMTYRQAGAIAVSLILGYVIFKFGLDFGVPAEILGVIAVIVGIITAVCFLVKIQGMYGNKRLPIWLNFHKRPKTCWSQNKTFRSKRIKIEPEMTKKEKKIKAKEEKAALKLAASETEFVGEDGECLTPKEVKYRQKKTARNKKIQEKDKS